MTKVVINRCWGGFGLSREAEVALVGCGHIELMEPEKYYGGRAGWEKCFEEEQKRNLFGVNFYEGKILIDNHRRDEARSCPKLIEVVERMGLAASGDLAELKVVEIPDGTDYAIDDYDGMETVEEAHRSWA